MKLLPSLTNMNVFKRLNILSLSARQILACVLALSLLLPLLPQTVSAAQDMRKLRRNPRQAPPYTQQTPEQLQQLVAPIALYPDSLVAQVLAASTFPAEIVEADRWVQANPDLKGDALAKAVDQQSWDPSVKALTAFPTVLGNMDKNISWTSSLGDAYYNQEQNVMDAIQVMRQKAQQAGNLKDTPQQTVDTQGSAIVIQPASPDVVYVPAYDPWLVYGYPVVAWPGWYPYPGIWFGGPSIYLGESASVSVSGAGTDGVGATGEPIGAIITWFITIIATTLAPIRFTTATITTAAAVNTVSLTTCSAVRSAAPPMFTTSGGGAGPMSTTVPAARTLLSTEIIRPRADTINSPTARPAPVPAASAAMTMAARPAVIPRAAVPASAAAAGDFTAVVVVVVDITAAVVVVVALTAAAASLIKFLQRS